MRTVTLEFLRQGSPNNQLLSLLTEYLVLCGNHPAETVRLPYLHSEFMVQLRALRYQDSNATREIQLGITAREMGEILSQIPGLIRELAEGKKCSSGMIHLSLVLSAHELALLPFELATSPNAFPGSGNPLSLQAEAPICVTREVRRVGSDEIGWPTRIRILFVIASPGTSPGHGPLGQTCPNPGRKDRRTTETFDGTAQGFGEKDPGCLPDRYLVHIFISWLMAFLSKKAMRPTMDWLGTTITSPPKPTSSPEIDWRHC